MGIATRMLFANVIVAVASPCWIWESGRTSIVESGSATRKPAATGYRDDKAAAAAMIKAEPNTFRAKFISSRLLP